MIFRFRRRLGCKASIVRSDRVMVQFKEHVDFPDERYTNNVSMLDCAYEVNYFPRLQYVQ